MQGPEKTAVIGVRVAILLLAGCGGTVQAGAEGSGTGGAGGTAGGRTDSCAVPPPTSCPNTTGGPRLVPVCGGYCIDETEVTNDQYAAQLATMPLLVQSPECLWNTDFAPGATTSCLSGSHVCQGAGCGNYPQVCVDWCDAQAYCRAVGKRLCGRIQGGANLTEDLANASASQWYNVCSSGGINGYPYGDTYAGSVCNGLEAPGFASVPVGSMGECASPVPGYEGVYDLSGNVWEWEDSCKASTGSNDDCRLRGGSLDPKDSLRCASDEYYYRSYQDDNIGFRCCAP